MVNGRDRTPTRHRSPQQAVDPLWCLDLGGSNSHVFPGYLHRASIPKRLDTL